MTEKVQLTISSLQEDLKQGLDRDAIAVKYGITKADVKRIFEHPNLKGLRVRKAPSFVLIDDVTPANAEVIAVTATPAAAPAIPATAVVPMAEEIFTSPVVEPAPEVAPEPILESENIAETVAEVAQAPEVTASPIKAVATEEDNIETSSLW